MSVPALHLALSCPVCGAEPGTPCPGKKSHVRRTPLSPCGTRGGYIRHVKEGTPPCDGCRDAQRRYMADYRQKKPDVREKDIADLRARKRAEKRLIDMHRADFDRLWTEEKGRPA